MFVAKPGWKLVDSDYSSAELFIAISQETSSYCLQLSKGMTLTVTSFLIFGQKWLDAGGSAEPGKPPTKEAADLRKV
jgi:hypothetical protein